jgi:hypothetical protein
MAEKRPMERSSHGSRVDADGQGLDAPARRVLVTGRLSLIATRIAARRGKIVQERDAWIQEAPGRAFEVWKKTFRSENRWTIALVELGRTVATGCGRTWEEALSQALGQTRKVSAP